MPADESKLYTGLKGKLEKISAGITKRSSDETFPKNIKKETIDAKLVELEGKRKDYDDASTVAHQKSEVFDKIFAECETLFSNIATQLYGAYGKQNRLVEDFGLKTYKKPSGRKPRNNGGK